MSWVKIDDGFEDHHKVVGLSDEAHRLWFRAICWTHQRANQVTQGFVPTEVVRKFCGSLRKTTRLTSELCNAKGAEVYGKKFGLWEEKTGGWQVHDWDDYAPADVKKTPENKAVLSKKRSEAGRRGAKSRWQNDSKRDSKLAIVPNGKPDSNAHGIPDPVPVTRYPLPLKSDDEACSRSLRAEPLALVENVQSASSESMTNLTDALALPLVERSQAVIDRPDRAQWVTPHRWPEVIQVVEALHAEAKLPGRVNLTGGPRDRVTPAALQLFASGLDPETVTELIPSIVASAWWREHGIDFSSLTERVIRRAQKASSPGRAVVVDHEYSR